MIYIASDHGGFELKKYLIENLKIQDVQDLGPYSLDPKDDYPNFVHELTQKLKVEPHDLGILICRNGVGVSMMANKYKFIRCGLCTHPDQAKTSKTDDNTNVLALGSDFITKEQALEIVNIWLNTSFSNESRHQRRLKEVANYTKGE